MKLFTLIALAALPFSAMAAPMIDQANVRTGNTFAPAVKVSGQVYATPYRFSTTEEAEAWVLSNLGIKATARRNIGGVDEDAAGNFAGSGSGF